MSIDWKRYIWWWDKVPPLAEQANDWVEVVRLTSSGADYEWAELYAFYSPAARRYFWYGDSGCSCNSWGENLVTMADFEDGSKQDLKRAMRAFAEGYGWAVTAGNLTSALDKLATFKEPGGAE